MISRRLAPIIARRRNGRGFAAWSKPGGWPPAEHDNLIRDDITVRLAGESGEGVISSGDILTTGAARTGYWALTFRTYPAEIRGGPCMYQVRVGTAPVRTQGDAVDLLICFNQEAFDLHHHELAADGHIVCDAESVRVSPQYESRSSEVPLATIAQEAGGNRRGKNMVSVGLVCGLLGLDTARIEEMILKRYAHKGDVGESNIKSLRAGFEHARDKLPAGAHKLGPARVPERGPAAGLRQPGDLPGRAAGGPRLLRRLSDHSRVGHPRVAGRAHAALRRRRDPDRGRDRRARVRAGRVVRGPQGDDRDVRARASR